jgi:primary-amine oxidase
MAAVPRLAHPLARLTADEIERTRGILAAAGRVSDATRFSYLLLREPHKDDVLDSAPVPREVSVLLTDIAANTMTAVVVDLGAGAVVDARDLDPAVDGFGPILDEDFERCDEIVKADAGWADAMRRRGITDMTTIRTAALSAGVFDYPDEVGVRMARVLAFEQQYPTDSVWAHPVDGVVAHVDLTTGRVLRLVETPIVHVPQESGDYTDPEVSGPPRTDLAPIEITQPEGRSFTLENDVLSWQGWKMRIGFNGRESLTLHQISFTQDGEERPVLYRASVSEMVVNYADPSPMHAWQNYFDAGEYQFGRLANSLELGCDCVGDIQYLDAIVSDDLGAPVVLRNAICVHEEDAGILWKHNDVYSGSKETRRQRRLVISTFVTVGNYDYGFYWYFTLDGTISLEANATGIVFTSGHDDSDYEFSTRLGPGLGAPIHQHLFAARLDTQIDGVRNAVDEIDVARLPVSADNPWGNAFTRTTTRLDRESLAQRSADGGLGRVWRISSSERTNRLGEPTAYVLHPEGQPTLLSAEGSSSARRAGFATKHLWVTRYERDELWAAGYTVNQHPGGAGLPAYASADRELDGQDVVLWHVFGLTHFPRLEDWPVMPVDHAGFTLKPSGFFDRNPTLDVPDFSADHCRPADHHGRAGHDHAAHRHDV